MECYGIIKAINYMLLIKNCLLDFPNKKRRINALVLFGYGTSSLINNSIADYLINPTYQQINHNTGFFYLFLHLILAQYKKNIVFHSH